MPDITPYFNLNLPVDDSISWGTDIRSNWTIIDTALKQIKDTTKNPQRDIQLHRESGDHDTIYYTKTQIDEGQLDNRYYSKTALSGGALNTRYYPKSQVYLRIDQFTKAEADALFEPVSTPDRYDQYFYRQDQLRDLTGGGTPTSLLATKAEVDALAATITTYALTVQTQINNAVASLNSIEDLIEFIQARNIDGKLSLYYSENGKAIGYSMEVRFKVVIGGIVTAIPLYYIPYSFDFKGLVATADPNYLPQQPNLPGYKFDSEVRDNKLVLLKPTVTSTSSQILEMHQFKYVNFGLDTIPQTKTLPEPVTPTAPTAPTGNPFSAGGAFYVLDSRYKDYFKDVTRGPGYGPDLSGGKNYSQFRKPYSWMQGRFHFFKNYYYAYTYSGSQSNATPNSLLKLDYSNNVLQQINVGYQYRNGSDVTSKLWPYYDPNSKKQEYYMTCIWVDEANNRFYFMSAFHVKIFNLSNGAFIKTIFSEPDENKKRLYGFGIIHPYIYIFYKKKAPFGILPTISTMTVMNTNASTPVSLMDVTTALHGGFPILKKMIFYNNKIYISRNDSSVEDATQMGEYVIDAYDVDSKTVGSDTFFIPEGQNGLHFGDNNMAPIAQFDFGSNINEGQGEWDGHFSLVV